MTKLINKNLAWYRAIHAKSFRSEKSALKYMSDTPEQNWQLIDSSLLPKKSQKVFGRTLEEFYEFNKFYENDLGQHIRMRVSDGDLFNISLLEFVEKRNVIDTEYSPILVNFFKSYANDSKSISKLFDTACAELDFEKLSKKEDLKLVNKWVVQQMQTMMTPIYFKEKYYAYLIIIVGEILLKNKLKGWFWKVEYTKVRLINFSDNVDITHIYTPYLYSLEGIKLDIHQACREYLFYEVGNVRNVFTNVYNNIEKYDVKKLYPSDYFSPFDIGD